MFSGIIREIGKIISLEKSEAGAVMHVQSRMFSEEGPSRPAVGDSIAHSGVCLTVCTVDYRKSCASFDLGSETLRCTTLGDASIGEPLNLERSLRAGDRLDGHLVQGHVDGIAEVLELSDEGSTRRMLFSLPAEVAALVAPKGAITVDGVSLTVGEVGERTFAAYIIPHTLNETVLQYYAPGRRVNIEADCVARYVARLITYQK